MGRLTLKSNGLTLKSQSGGVTVKVAVVGATLNEGAAADALGRLGAVTHLRGQARGGPVRDDQHAPLDHLALWHASQFWL